MHSEPSTSGTPAWVVTFADLMSLLMCFFVLLLSFSELDAAKFKQIAGELSQAFGVQRDVPALEPPKGTSAVFMQYSPGRPDPTVLDQVRQASGGRPDAPAGGSRTSARDALATTTAEHLTQATAAALREALAAELQAELLHIEEEVSRIVLRVEENGSFASGSADVTPAFDGLLGRMVDILARVPGDLTIEGHTDDVPIRTSRFSSNWDLSAARAASVANAIIARGAIEAPRLRVVGLAETRPRQPNGSADRRARNRRVEMVIDQHGDVQAIEVELERLRTANRHPPTPQPTAVGP
jgi:chemotaxis protein MotB